MGLGLERVELLGDVLGAVIAAHEDGNFRGQGCPYITGALDSDGSILHAGGR
jgi:hypothetical protein